MNLGQNDRVSGAAGPDASDLGHEGQDPEAVDTEGEDGPAAAQLGSKAVKCTSDAAREENVCTIGPSGDEEPPDDMFDRTHAYLSRTLSQPAVWFDSFFGDRRIEEEGPPGVFVRWSNALRWSELEGVTLRTRFRASVRLPALKRKVRLFIAGDRDDDPEEDQAPTTVVDPGIETGREQSQTDLGLRIDLIRDPFAKFDIGAGIRLKGLQPYTRARFRYAHPLGEESLFRFTETAYYRDDEGFSETTRVDLEHLLNPVTLLRLSNYVSYVENVRGVDYVPEATLFWMLSRRSAVSLDISALMRTRPHADWQNFRVGVKYRRNIFRPWLFFEIEPEISWPRNEFGDQTSVKAITFLIEIQFLRTRS